MESTGLSYDDFFMSVKDEYKDFVREVNERVAEAGYTKINVGTNKTNLYKVAFAQPKTRKGIANFYLRKKGLKMTISAKHCADYPETFAAMNEEMKKQIDKAHDCKNLVEGGGCMDKCAGYNFRIGETPYQKCKFGCFLFDVEKENLPVLRTLLESELKARG